MHEGYAEGGKAEIGVLTRAITCQTKGKQGEGEERGRERGKTAPPKMQRT